MKTLLESPWHHWSRKTRVPTNPDTLRFNPRWHREGDASADDIVEFIRTDWNTVTRHTGLKCYLLPGRGHAFADGPVMAVVSETPKSFKARYQRALAELKEMAEKYGATAFCLIVQPSEQGTYAHWKLLKELPFNPDDE